MLVITLFASMGITFTIQHKMKFLRGRVGLLDSMLKCTFCTGFHGGWMAYLLSYGPVVNIREVLLFALCSAWINFAADEITKFFERGSKALVEWRKVGIILPKFLETLLKLYAEATQSPFHVKKEESSSK